MRILLQTVLFLSIFSSLIAETIGYFNPPENWVDADPRLLAPMVQMGYFGKGEKELPPSINIATEDVEEMSLKEYLEVVKDIHTSNRTTTWRNLGKFQTEAGKGQLTEITAENQMGKVKMLQLIFIKNNTAYILTGASLKEEFSKFRNAFVKSFRTFKLTDNLFAELKDAKREEALQAKLSGIKETLKNQDVQADQKQKELLDFHKHVTSNYKDMGQYWQYLVIKDLHNAIVPKEIKE